MKRIISIFSVFLLSIVVTKSQTNYGDINATDFLTIGLGGSIGYSMATNTPPTGLKVSPKFGTQFGLDLIMPFSRMLSGGLSIGLDNRATGIFENSDNNNTINNQLNYISIFPFLKISTLIIGVNFGLPKSGKFTVNRTSASEISTDYSDEDVKSVDMMIEPRLGAVAPLLDEEIGWLGLTFSLGYCINKIYKENQTGALVALTNLDKKFDGNLASAHLGLTWDRKSVV